MHVFETSLHTLVQPLVYYAFQLLDKESSASREIYTMQVKTESYKDFTWPQEQKVHSLRHSSPKLRE